MHNDEELRALLGDKDDVLARVDATGRILRFFSGPKYLGRGETELIGRRVTEFLPPDDGARVLRAIADAIALGTPQIVEHRRPSPVGMRVVRARVVRTEDGCGALAHLVDVTDEVRTREALDETAERFRLLARATTDAVFDWDVERDEARWTDSIRATFGFEAGIVTDLRWWLDRIHPDDKDAVTRSVNAALADTTKEVWEGEFCFRGADDVWFDVFERSLLIRNDSGAVVRVVGSLLDVTERRQLTRRLVVAERLSALGTFAASLAHEVKNPLSVVATNIALAQNALARDASTPDALPCALAAIDDANRGVARIAGILDGLHVFNAQARDPAPVDLATVVKLALTVARGDLERVARIDLDLDEGHLVHGHPEQLGQVVLNLLANARDAVSARSPGDGRISVRLARARDEVLLDVEDNGVGFQGHDVAQLFEAFFTTKPPDHGTGIGLAVCKEIIASHGGSISAAPVIPSGARFRVRLPVQREASALTEVVAPSRRLRILFVDDDDLTRRLAVRILEGAHDIAVAASVAEAAKLASAHSFDVIVTDVNMQPRSGFELLELPAAARVPIAFVSANASELRPGMRWLRKPFSAEELCRFVADAANGL